MAERKASVAELLKESTKQDLAKSDASTMESEMSLRDVGRADASAAVQADVEKAVETSTVGESAAQPETAAVAGPSKTASLADSSASSGSSISVRAELLTHSARSCEVSDVAKVAAKTARNAANACRRVMTATVEAISTGKKQVETALRRAEEAAEVDDVNYYTNLAVKYGTAIASAAVNVHNVEEAANVADRAANNAIEAAVALSEPRDENSPDEEVRIKTACWAANSANSASIMAFRMEYMALQAMKDCWKHIDDAENLGSASILRRRITSGRNCDARPDSKFIMVVNIIVFLLGTATLSSLGFVKFSDDTRPAVLSLGLMLISWPALHSLYKLIMCYRRRKLEAKVNKTREEIEKINNRLGELSVYFENNSISPVVSESESD